MQNADGDLMDLGARLRAAWDAERAFLASSDIDADGVLAEFDRLCLASAKIVHDIEAAPAAGIDGLRVKALAVSWCHAGAVDLGSTRDLRIAGQIIAALAKM